MSGAANGANSTMPGDYGAFPRPAALNANFPNAPRPTGPIIPPAPRPYPPSYMPSRRPSMAPPMRPMRTHRRRRRSLTPDIVIERRSHGHRSSGGRHRVFTIPLDHRPTLGLRGPPRRVLEIERVRCHRRRRCRSPCYEDDYYPPPLPQQPASNIVVANPCPPSVQMASMSPATALINNLTPEAIENLPKQTVHLPPIHLPGSQADASTELHTVIFPAEIINPIDGTLSIIQGNSAANTSGGMMNIPPQMIHTPPTLGIPIATGAPPVSPAMAADPLMQRFRELFQRLSVPQTQPRALPGTTASFMQPIMPYPPMIRPAAMPITEFNPASATGTGGAGPYPSANIRPTNPVNPPPYRPSTTTPYRPSTFAPTVATNNNLYRPSNPAPLIDSDIGPYRPANITPYSNRPVNNTSMPPSGPAPYTAPSIMSSSSFNSLPPSTLLPPPPGAGQGSDNAYTPYPRSILRNPLPSTAYTRFNPSSAPSQN